MPEGRKTTPVSKNDEIVSDCCFYKRIPETGQSHLGGVEPVIRSRVMGQLLLPFIDRHVHGAGVKGCTRHEGLSGSPTEEMLAIEHAWRAAGLLACGLQDRGACWEHAKIARYVEDGSTIEVGDAVGIGLHGPDRDKKPVGVGRAGAAKSFLAIELSTDIVRNGERQLRYGLSIQRVIDCKNNRLPTIVALGATGGFAHGGDVPDDHAVGLRHSQINRRPFGITLCECSCTWEQDD
jgi:hypothetical protein